MCASQENTISSISQCKCMNIFYNSFENYVTDSKMGHIYNKCKYQENVTKKEYNLLLDFILFEINPSKDKLYRTQCYKNNYISNNRSKIKETCSLRYSVIDYQEYDEYGPVDKGEIEYYDCYSGYSIDLPNSIDIVIITFLLNTMTCESMLPHYEKNAITYLLNVTEFCIIYNIYNPYICSEYVTTHNSNKITFDKFKGFYYYYSILNKN